MKRIKLSKGKSAIVDDDDYEMLSKFKWHVVNNEYFYAATSSKNIFMSTLIMQPTNDYVVIHENKDTLDCRKENMSICTRSQSLARRKINKTNKTGYKGVSFEQGRFRARIKSKIHLGYFDHAIDAAIAYNEAAREFFGNYANTNKICPTQHALDAATAARLPSSFSAEVINPAMGQGATRRAQ